jgi:hypothetical protein
MWDCYGLETIFNITDYEKNAIWSKLKGEPVVAKIPNLNHLILRAKFNHQRNYEIYIITAVDGIGAEDIKEMFEANPQNAADTCRRLGQKLYSDRSDDRRVIV